MKVAALNALQQMDEARARPILRRVLARRDAASTCLRRKAVFLVAQQNEPGTEDILLESVRSDPDAEVRRHAVFWLSQVGTDRAVGASVEGWYPTCTIGRFFRLDRHTIVTASCADEGGIPNPL